MQMLNLNDVDAVVDDLLSSLRSLIVVSWLCR